MEDRIPPQALDIERCLLGTFLGDPASLVGVYADLPVSAFFSAKNAEIYSAMVSMVQENRVFDVITLVDVLKNRGSLDRVGGPAYLAELAEAYSTRAMIGEYLKIVSEKAIYRDIIAKCHDISKRAYDEQKVEDILGQLETLCVKIGADCDRASIKRKRRGEVIRVRDIAESVFKYHSEGFQNIGISLSNSWPRLSEHYRPAKGTLNVLTGIPGHGKSEFLDALMVNISLERGWKWAVFSPENYPWELYIQKLSEKILNKTFFGQINDAELSTCLDWIDEHFFLIEPDEDNISVESLLLLNLDAIEKHGVDGCIWDPWNEISMDLAQNEKETDYIGRNLSRIRRFARRHNVLQFIVAHPAKMQRDLKTKKYLVPTLYDINGSANWYNKTDNGFCVYRNFDTKIIDLHIQKIKFKVHGKVGCVPFTYDICSGRFVEVKDDGGFTEEKAPDSEQTTFWQDKI